MPNEGEPNTGRVFTEGEAYALVADAVARETASANTKAEELARQVAALQTERDAMEVRATAAETEKAAAEQALTDFKAEIEAQKAAEAKRGTRFAQVTEVAPSLKLEGDRGDRIVAMSDEHFAEYLESLREVAASAPHPFTEVSGKSECKTCGGAREVALHVGTQKAAASGTLPRESAAFGGNTNPGDSPVATVKSMFDAARVARAQTA